MTGVSLLTANNQSKTATSSNRTFADSVINHQYNQYTSSSNNNTHRNGNAGDRRGRMTEGGKLRRRLRDDSYQSSDDADSENRDDFDVDRQVNK